MSSGGRRRAGNQNLSSEDQALNMIAREAEARLAAKRAARAEARSIRMKELERQQQEADIKMDKEYHHNLMTDDTSKKRRNVPEEVPRNSDGYVKSLQDSLREVEDNYRRAMVSNAQLDNEKQALSYQVDYLKDRLGDEEENVLNLKDELTLLNREYNSVVRKNERNLDEIEKMKYVLSERDRILEEYGINPDGTKNPEHEEQHPAPLPNGLDSSALDVADLSPTDKVSFKSQSSVGSTAASEDRELLLEQIKTLKDEVAELRRESDSEAFQIRDAAVDDLRRELQKSSADFRLKVQKLEQENARLEGSVIRLEAQVKRYKSQAESAEATEDSLLAEKRKVGRELRQAQEIIMELETEKEHLQKRVDKLKSRRKDDF